jgi:hypothetical protein
MVPRPGSDRTLSNRYLLHGLYPILLWAIPPVASTSRSLGKEQHFGVRGADNITVRAEGAAPRLLPHQKEKTHDWPGVVGTCPRIAAAFWPLGSGGCSKYERV